MEILLLACMLAYAAGAQSEQSKLGLSPAQRATMREQTRHDKAVRKIAEKHGAAPHGSPKPATSTWKEAPAATPAVTIPEAFRSGYRGHTPIERVATPLGRRTGAWAAQGVTWARDTGRGAVREYRNRRRVRGQEDPAPALVPPPPAAAPTDVPPEAAEEPKGDEQPPTTGGDGAQAAPEVPTAPEVETEPEPQPEPAEPDAPPATADTKEGVGRMAAEVTYESVADESDELSLMCEDDVRVYERIRDRAEREIGRGDDLIAAMQATGFGPKVIAWVARCKENYGVIHSEVDDLQSNTIAQGDGVVKAKGLLEAGQGVYADIAKDMEDVAERDAYISDAVDAEDTSADTEVYETKAVA